MRIRVLVLIVILSCAASFLNAAVSLPSLISDHMLMQQQVPVRIWGKANPGESVTVKFRGQTVATRAGEDSRWEVFLQPMEPGDPAPLRIEADNSITVRDVLVGEVWVASGQSNMQFSVNRAKDAEKEAAAATYPRMRLFQVKLTTAESPVEDVEGEWVVCSPETAPGFSAVGYYFGRYLHKQLNVPVGMIQSAWGGTPAQSWTSIEALQAEPKLDWYLSNWDRQQAELPSAMLRYQEQVEKWEEEAKAAKAAGRDIPRKPREPLSSRKQWAPASLYNAMIAPLTPYAIRGAIWYQGESNANVNEGYLYRTLFQTMIQDWRDRWAVGNFPFLYVQLANFERGETEEEWVLVCESQTDTLRLRNTGMAVAIDIGNPTDIHPTNKQDAGKRLALWALAETYGKKLVHSGPIYRQMSKEGDKLRLWFDHVGSGLKAEGGELKGFLIAGADRVFVSADAKLDGNTVVVSSPEVKNPQAARYAWASNPENTLRNEEGLPAPGFRTDRWTNARIQ